MIRALVTIVCLLSLNQCYTGRYVHIDSVNQNSRIDYVVLHGTSENFSESLRLLTEATDYPVSSHYLIPELDDPTYRNSKLRIYSLVPEQRRAWHAGVSYWAGETGLNDRSIGIELVNEFKCENTEKPINLALPEDVRCQFPTYSDAQIKLLVELLHDILDRHPELDPIDIVAHSDVAIMRKSDPGPLFPWRLLYENGIGAWPDKDTLDYYRDHFNDRSWELWQFQKALSALGYQLEVTGLLDSQTMFAVRAFQIHFRPADFSGDIDLETRALVWSLLQKYRPQALREIELSAPLELVIEH